MRDIAIGAGLFIAYLAACYALGSYLAWSARQQLEPEEEE